MISISIPSDNPEVKEILEEIAEVCGKLLSTPCVPLEEAETCVRDLMLRSGQKLLEMCVSEAASQQSAEPVECPQCEQACRLIQKRDVNITTLCGKSRVRRWVYECGAGDYHRPWDAKQKLQGKWTRRVIERMCYVAACFDYRAAAKELAFQGIEVSHTTVRENFTHPTFTGLFSFRFFEQILLQTLIFYSHIVRRVSSTQPDTLSVKVRSCRVSSTQPDGQ